ncbi:MAG TPA: DUF58 domain-containing protein [Sedimentisphaerales bacterium]|jgi:uncharacterized protein (DUF58 family)|nr:DUF58 domain-containing protein [Sedimentisphaerales bacterium]HNU29788.1 DUF58 domain-containing protein [Sedimentisphaerales bacterium]
MIPSQSQILGGMIDPATLMKIRSMELRAKAVVEGFWKGIHRSPYHGFSAEFTEYRQYTAGDDPRHIDWRVFARSDRYYIKKFEDETNLRCHLLIDHSRSMGYGSGGYTKSQYAGTLGATLAYFLFTQGDAVGLATFDDRIREYMPPRNRPSYLRRLMTALDAQPRGKATDLGAPLQRIAHMLTRRGMIVLISDLLTSIDRLERDLGCLRAGGHDVVLFHILDPAELHFDFDAPALFQDVESGRDLYVDPPAVQKSYRHMLAQHLHDANAICVRLGIDYHLFATDRPFDAALLEFLQHRMRIRKQVRRIRAPGGGRRI